MGFVLDVSFFILLEGSLLYSLEKKKKKTLEGLSS